jgi:hypothetical protein
MTINCMCVIKFWGWKKNWYGGEYFAWGWPSSDRPKHVAIKIWIKHLKQSLRKTVSLTTLSSKQSQSASFSLTHVQYKKTKLHGLSPRANYTDQATAACRRSDYQLVRIEGATWSVWRIPPAVFSFSRQEPRLFYQVACQYSRGWVDPVPDPLLFFLVVPGIEPGPPDL